MPKTKDTLFIVAVFLLGLQWVYFKFTGTHLPSPWNAFAPGIAIFAAAYALSWGAELAQFEIPQSLAIAFLALIAVLPEYAVDMYFAWQAGKDPAYIHYATANMTGSNRLLIGVGWAAVAFAASDPGAAKTKPVPNASMSAMTSPAGQAKNSAAAP